MTVHIDEGEASTTQADLAEALGHANYRAKRTSRYHPDKAAIHDFINTLLDRWEAAGA